MRYLSRQAKINPVPRFMRKALSAAYSGCFAGAGGPFGCCIVSNGRLISSACNTVLKDNDPTAHAEINAIRIAARRLRTYQLRGCLLYTTTEPCPMCFSAIHWARIDAVIYGTAIKDVKKLGFNELTIGARDMKKIGRAKVDILSGFLVDECRGLLDYWAGLAQKKVY